MRKQALTLFVFLLAAPAPAQDTLKPGDTLSGKLRVVKTHHPNGTPITGYQIVVGHPKNFAKEDDRGGLPMAFHRRPLMRKTRALIAAIFSIGRPLAALAQSADGNLLLNCFLAAYQGGGPLSSKERTAPLS
jgi:hypothetical protein